MTALPHVSSYRDLIAYKKSRDLARNIFQLSRSFPKEEAYALTDQIRRSSRSIGAQIAEAWGKRRYEKHFISKLPDADSEQYETQHWIETARDCGYLTAQQTKDLRQNCEEIGRLIGGMIIKAPLFCNTTGNILKEPEIVYSTEEDQ
jgi:four helix bundle protein